MSLAPVEYCPELERVIRIPRRQWSMSDAEAWAARLTPLLRTPAGEAAGAQLLPLQGLCLAEAYQVGGGFYALPVGEGKTLLAWLLPYVLQARAIYLNPANLMPDRQRDFAVLSKHWVTARPPAQMVSYTALTREENWDLLRRYRPKLIIADEGDLLRNPDSSMCMRLDEYHELDPECMFAILTGTPMRKSIKNVCHLLKWTHKKWAPVPLTYKAKESWSNALDEKVDMISRQRPGALLHLATPEDKGRDDLETARRAFQRRLWETPGIVYVDKQSCDAPLNLRLLQAPEDPLLDEAFRHFRTFKATPPFPGEEQGWELEGPLDMYRVGNELGCGFFSRFDPLPPSEWRARRKAWVKFCNSKIGTHSRGGRLLATELMVAKEYKDDPLHLAWREIEPTFKPNSVPQWVSGSAISFAKAWLDANGPAIVWCPHVAVCQALARITGCPFFGAGGESEDGESILNLSPKRSAICSIHSNKRGRNLQTHPRNLVLGWPQPGTDAEQLLGRPHRKGQRDPVYFDVIISCAEHLYAIDMTYREAGYVKVMQGQTQKILIANIDSSHVSRYSYPRWSKE